MAKIEGRLIQVLLDDTKVNGVITKSLNVERNMIDTTDDDSGGNKEFIPGHGEWTIEAEMNYDAADAKGFKELFDDWSNKTSRVVKFGGVENGDDYWTGTVYVQSLPLTAPTEDKVTYSVTFRGTGAITRSTV